MNKSFQQSENEAVAQNYYPKALNLGQQESEQKVEAQSTANSPLSSLLSNMFQSGNSNSQPQLSQLLGGNPLLSTLLSGNLNQSDMMSKLMSSFLPKTESKDEKEKVIDLSSSVEEL